MFEIVPLHFAIGKGWFSTQQGFAVELDFFSINIYFPQYQKDFQGSLFAVYFDLWREDGKLNKEFSWDLLYLYHLLKKKAPPSSKVL